MTFNIIVFFLIVCTTRCLGIGYSQGNCKEIQRFHQTAPSGIYYIVAGTYHIIEVYCEMGLNGGGYTFLSPKSLTEISNADLQSLITDRKSLLMRIRRCDGTQPYTVLEQLPQYADITIKFAMNDFTGYQGPINAAVIGSPYLFAGFLPRNISAARTLQGFKANGVNRNFNNADGTGNSYMALFPNFGEKGVSNFGLDINSYNYPFCNDIFNGSLPNSSNRVMPLEYFMFGEFHFGGGGCYTQTDARLSSKCILGLHIGFR